MSERKIEDVVRDVLKGDAQKNALDLIAHLRTSGGKDFSIAKHNESDESLWLIGEGIGVMFVNGSDDFPGPWTLWVDGDNIGEHTAADVDAHVKEVAWANIAPCGSCGGQCSPGFRKRVFGKDFENVCNSTLMFTNADTDTLACLKQIVDVRKADILGHE